MVEVVAAMLCVVGVMSIFFGFVHLTIPVIAGCIYVGVAA